MHAYLLWSAKDHASRNFQFACRASRQWVGPASGRGRPCGSHVYCIVAGHRQPRQCTQRWKLIFEAGRTDELLIRHVLHAVPFPEEVNFQTTAAWAPPEQGFRSYR